MRPLGLGWCLGRADSSLLGSAMGSIAPCPPSSRSRRGLCSGAGLGAGSGHNAPGPSCGTPGTAPRGRGTGDTRGRRAGAAQRFLRSTGVYVICVWGDALHLRGFAARGAPYGIIAQNRPRGPQADAKGGDVSRSRAARIEAALPGRATAGVKREERSSPGGNRCGTGVAGALAGHFSPAPRVLPGK